MCHLLVVVASLIAPLGEDTWPLHFIRRIETDDFNCTSITLQSRVTVSVAHLEAKHAFHSDMPRASQENRRIK